MKQSWLDFNFKTSVSWHNLVLGKAFLKGKDEKKN